MSTCAIASIPTSFQTSMSSEISTAYPLAHSMRSKRLAPAGEAAGQRMRQLGQLGIEGAQQRSRHQLGHAAAASGTAPRPPWNGARVRTLDELDLRDR
jgi:hypothetical protein